MLVIAKKSLGQNFLIDPDVIKIIIKCAPIQGKEILEVGPGTGNLTEKIIDGKPSKIYLIEKDNILLNQLKKKINYNVEFLNEDILEIDEKNLSKNKLTVFGNLPYNISTKILTRWIVNLDSKIWFDKLVLMFQKEVAQRIISQHNTPYYGRLSVISNWKLNIEKITDIKPRSFSPRPKVDSSLLIFTPKTNFKKICSEKSLEKVTRIFFNQRRKKIKKTFNELFNK